MTLVSEALKGISSFDKQCDIIREMELVPESGPFSFSRLEEAKCPFKYNKTYRERAEGLQISRFGVNDGSGMHEVADLDMQARMRGEDIPVEDIVSVVIEGERSYEPFRGEFEQRLRLMRVAFESNGRDFMGSEMRLAVDFDMKYVPWSSPKAWFRGIIDYSEIDQEWHGRVVDYKNYPRIHSDYELNNQWEGVGCQTMGYMAMMMAFEPRMVDAYSEVYYFRFGTSRTTTTDDGGIRYITRDQVKAWWEVQQRRMIAVELMQDYPAIPSPSSCQYCSHIHECPVKLKGDEYIVRNAREAKRMAEGLVVQKEKEKRAKDALKKYIDERGNIKLASGEEIGHVPTTRYDINAKVLLESCRAAGIDPSPYVTISKTNAAKIISQLPEEYKEQAQQAVVKRTDTRRKLT